MISLYNEYLPEDRTPEEVKILNAIMVKIYNNLTDPTDKFILAFTFHLGYGKEDTARALGISYVAVYRRIKKIQSLLEPVKSEVLGEVKVNDKKIVV